MDYVRHLLRNMVGAKMKYYLDTEFDGFGGNLLSLALVREDGASVYYMFDPARIEDDWVRENVAPLMRTCPGGAAQVVLYKTAAMDLAGFLEGDPDPIIISDWPADIRYFCELIEFEGGNMAPIPRLKFELRRVDAYPSDLPGAVQHNAWWDAMALRHLLMKPTKPA